MTITRTREYVATTTNALAEQTAEALQTANLILARPSTALTAWIGRPSTSRTRYMRRRTICATAYIEAKNGDDRLYVTAAWLAEL